MIALDTNVVVRAVTRDEPDQAAAAEALLRDGRFWLSKTVILETEWVLRHGYRMRREAIYRALEHLLGFERMEVESRGQVLAALGWFEAGLDFADALHLAACPDHSTLATFDRELANVASRLEGAPTVRLLTT